MATGLATLCGAFSNASARCGMARTLRSAAGMRPTLFAFVCVMAIGACASEPQDARDLGSDDSADDEAKTDAARPAGMFHVIDASSFGDDDLRIVDLDLRRNGSFYIDEVGFLPNGDHDRFFGGYAFRKDSAGNRFIRVRTEDGASWRYGYKVVDGDLHFLDASGNVAWKMRQQRDPSTTHIDRVQEVFNTGKQRTPITTRTASQPEALWAQHDTSIGDWSVYTLTVDNKVHYVLENEDNYNLTVDIYAQNNQLLATGFRAYGWVFDQDLF
jgi:hypothetical protein